MIDVICLGDTATCRWISCFDSSGSCWRQAVSSCRRSSYPLRLWSSWLRSIVWRMRPWSERQFCLLMEL